MTEDSTKLSLATLEGEVGLDSQVGLTEIEADLRIEEGMVRVQGGRTDIALRKHMAYWLLVLFSVNTGGALAMIFLVGIGKMLLSEKVIMSVLGATVLEAAAMLVTVTKYLFPAKA